MPGQNLAENEIQDYLESKLVAKDHPDYYIFFEKFPTVGSRRKVRH